ncbi:MAG: nucleotidyltransferase [Rudaea sp.]|uniref:nucleotidyltransferase domain-containing protein n=1 Tax=Rudaea sp. TaxID=2136325 RepID=UPI0039E39C7B
MNDLNIGIVPSRDAVTAALLSRLAYNLDLTSTQYERARSAYETVGSVLAADLRLPLARSKVFPQGSFALGTVVKPLADSDEGFDVDLICRLASTEALLPAQAKALVGTCLANDGRYKDKLKEKARCWRVVFAGEFHMDIAPVVPRLAGGDLIPDRELRVWIPTAPELYATWFNRLADAAQTRRLTEAYVIKAEVIPFPDDPAERGWLRRLVQVLKRHRCVWRDSLPATRRDYAPISIIITTLAAYAFGEVASAQRFDSPLDSASSRCRRYADVCRASLVAQRARSMVGTKPRCGRELF